MVEGDTARLALVNPEDDEHTLVLPGRTLTLPPERTTRADYVAPRAGVYPIYCNIPSHLPMMSGQLVVLSPLAVGGAPSR